MLARLKNDLIAKVRGWSRREEMSLSQAETARLIEEGAHFHREGDWANAEAAYRRVLSVAPRDPNALHLLGLLTMHRRDLDGAERLLRAAVENSPATPDYHNSLASVLSETARVTEAAGELRAALAAKPNAYRPGSNLLFLLNLLPNQNRAEMFDVHVNWSRMHLPEPPEPLYRASSGQARGENGHRRRLRIGYVSADFCAHPVGRILANVLPRHDPGLIEVFCYSNVKSADYLTERIKEGVEHWRDIHGVSEAEAAHSIVADGIDILVDLAGHTRRNRLPVFALRPAPVQATWLGYLNTTGMTQMDWRITSALADPPLPGTKGAQHFHTERLHYLPSSLWPWNVVGEMQLPTPGEPPCANSDEIVFASFNSFRKVNTEVMEVWAEILRRVPNARLRMFGVPLGATVDRILDLFERNGIADGRVELMAPAPYEKYMQSYAQVDIALDTFPYSGGATACECLWMGVPVIAMAGDGGFARTSTCLLQSLDLGQLVAQNRDQYIAAAVALAREPQRIRAYRHELRPRMQQSPAGDPQQFTRHLEEAYAAMWADWTERRNADARGHGGDSHAAVAAPDAGISSGTPIGEFGDASGAVAEEWLASQARNDGRLGEAELHYRRAIQFDPESAVLHYNLGLLLHEVGLIDAAEEEYRQSLRFEPARHATHSSLLSLADFKTDLGREDNLRAHVDWGRVFADPLTRKALPHAARAGDAERALRVGYVSADLGGHVIGGFVAPLLQHHGSAFETYCYSARPFADAHQQRLQSLAGSWRDISALDDDAAAAMIRADGIDILIDLAGHSAGNRLGIFARKPAPVQMTWMGYLNTTGMAAMDYRITDWGCDPEGAERWYREKLLRLPHPQWCYVRDGAPPATTVRQGASSQVVFGCATRFMKINDAVFALWIEILSAAPEARLRVIDVPDHPRTGDMKRRADQAGVGGRIDWLPTLRGQDYWDYLASLDIALDPFPYTGATTTFDCLWMNLPVVTLAGICGPARSAASILSEMGCAELVASSHREYVATAANLADPGRTEGLRATLRERMKVSPGRNAELFTRNIETLYRDAWRRWCREGG